MGEEPNADVDAFPSEPLTVDLLLGQLRQAEEDEDIRAQILLRKSLAQRGVYPQRLM